MPMFNFVLRDNALTGKEDTWNDFFVYNKWIHIYVIQFIHSFSHSFIHTKSLLNARYGFRH